MPESLHAEATSNDSNSTSAGSASSTAEAIGRRAGRSLRWTLLGSVISKLGSLGMGLVLARLLTPEDFGTYAIAAAALAFVLHVNDIGVMAAVVQWRGRFEDVAPTGSVLAFLSSIVIYAAFFVGAVPFAALAGDPAAAPVVQLLTTVILIDGVTAVRVASLQRCFRLNRLVQGNLVGLVLQAVVSIWLAAAGAGAYAFAWGQVVGSCATGVFVFAAAQLPLRLEVRRTIAAKLMRFGVPVAFSLGVEAILLNADYVIVGQMLGTATLGYYLLAFNISSWLPTAVGTAVRYVSIPSFSRLSEDSAIFGSSVQRALTMLFTAILPVAIIMTLLAEPLIEFLYGAKWMPSAPILQVLAALSLFRMLVALVTEALLGSGQTLDVVWLNTGWALALVPALIVGTHLDGARGTAAAHASVALLVAIPLATLALRRMKVPLGTLARSTVRPIFAAAIAGSCCFVVATLPSHPLAILLLAGGSASALYILIVTAGSTRRRTVARLLPSIARLRARRRDSIRPS
jgi:PST family polysaccharide transporter